MLTLIFCSRQCVCAFTAFFRRYVKSMQWAQIASIPKALLALTRLLLQAPSEKSMILASSFNNKLARARLTFALLVIRMNSIDCKYLRRNGVNTCTQCREQKIRQGISHRLKHWRSSRRRRNIDKPPSRKRIMQKTLFTQREVRLQSTKGRHLLSP